MHIPDLKTFLSSNPLVRPEDKEEAGQVNCGKKENERGKAQPVQ